MSWKKKDDDNNGKRGKDRKKKVTCKEKEKKEDESQRPRGPSRALWAADLSFPGSVKVRPSLSHNMESESIFNYSLYLWNRILHSLLLI